jgi:nicotinamide phosphoribosyltransferase
MYHYSKLHFIFIAIIFSGLLALSSGHIVHAKLSDNPLLDTDSYKVSHWNQYPPGTDALFGYLESRGGDHEKIVFFGLQYILREYFENPITQHMVEEARAFYSQHFRNETIFNYEGWTKVVTKHGGRLPMRIRAVAEGSVVPTSQVLVTMESTDPELFWIPSWFETQLMRVWYPINVATISYYAKRTVLDFLIKTSEPPFNDLPFKLHDFGSRGVSSQESAAIGGAAHLVNFMGSDTIPGIRMAQHYYHASSMPAFSIPAAEHSTITSWGPENEVRAYKHLLDTFAKTPDSIIAVVSDSYNLWDAITKMWGGTLRSDIIASQATVVIRPDSGDPVTVILESLRRLEAVFGATTNSKDCVVSKCKIINHKVRLIQGDGINLTSMKAILDSMYAAGYSTDNINFGMGGGLLQSHNRDTQKFAIKTSSIHVSGEPKNRDVFKDPVTDPGKKSKKGRLDLVMRHGEYATISMDDPSYNPTESQLRTVYENGKFAPDQTLDEIRVRTAATLPQ